MIHKYVKPKMKNLFDNIRNMQPVVNNTKFYTNGYFAIKMDLLPKYYPTLYGKIMSSEREISTPDLQQLLDKIDMEKMQELHVTNILEMDSFSSGRAFLANKDESIKITLNAEFLSIFTKIFSQKLGKYGYRISGKFYGIDSTKLVLVKSSNEIIGAIMPVSNA